MVTLDLGGLPRAALDDVRVERALDEEAGVRELGRFLLEAADELLADDLALALRIGDAGQLAQEASLASTCTSGTLKVLVNISTTFRLRSAHHALVDEDARELIADGPVDKKGRDRRIDPAGEAEDRLGGADLRRMRRTCSSMIEAGVQVGRQPQPRNRKSRRTSMPFGVWTTSGWNWTP